MKKVVHANVAEENNNKRKKAQNLFIPKII
jgi:hypothetical protein